MFRISFPVLILFSFFASCKNDIETVNLITANNKAPNETGKNVEIIYSDSAKIKVKITGPVLEHYSKDTAYVLFPKGVHTLFYDDSAKVKTELTAKYAIRYENLGRMEARNDVVLVNEKGERLNTEKLTWDEQKKLIYTDAFVKIKTADEIIYGDGLESNEDFTKYKIKNIKGTLGLTEEQKKQK